MTTLEAILLALKIVAAGIAGWLAHRALEPEPKKKTKAHDAYERKRVMARKFLIYSTVFVLVCQGLEVWVNKANGQSSLSLVNKRHEEEMHELRRILTPLPTLTISTRVTYPAVDPSHNVVSQIKDTVHFIKNDGWFYIDGGGDPSQAILGRQIENPIAPPYSAAPQIMDSRNGKSYYFDDKEAAKEAKEINSKNAGKGGILVTELNEKVHEKYPYYDGICLRVENIDVLRNKDDEDGLQLRTKYSNPLPLVSVEKEGVIFSFNGIQTEVISKTASVASIEDLSGAYVQIFSSGFLSKDARLEIGFHVEGGLEMYVEMKPLELDKDRVIWEGTIPRIKTSGK